jgi:flagellar export protein FliJ
MKAFSFRLEPILHLREGARKSALTIYAKSIRESQKLENELFTLEQSLEDMKKVISAQRKRKFQPSSEIPHQASMSNLKDEINSKQKELQHSRHVENQKRDDFISSDNALKSVSRLKQKQQTVHMSDQIRKEELELEDIISSRYTFNLSS